MRFGRPGCGNRCPGITIAILGRGPFATACHRLQPRGSTKAPFFVVDSDNNDGVRRRSNSGGALLLASTPSFVAIAFGWTLRTSGRPLGQPSLFVNGDDVDAASAGGGVRFGQGVPDHSSIFGARPVVSAWAAARAR